MEYLVFNLCQMPLYRDDGKFAESDTVTPPLGPITDFAPLSALHIWYDF
jgi:hypothetical protein